MKITIVSVQVETKPTAKGSYQVAVVAYKNEQGKIEGKNVMSFGAAANTFKTLSQASAGEVYNVTAVKNDKGYWDWTAAERTTAEAAAKQTTSVQSTGNAAPKGNWETPTERAQRQVYIVRQSSLANAVSVLTIGAKTPPTTEAIIALAKQFENHVFDTVALVEQEEKTMVKVTDGFEDSDIPL